MKQITTQININASSEQVWQVLSDLPNWPKWNPIVNHVDGSFQEGEKISITMRDENGSNANSYSSVITEIDEAHKFSFVGKMMANTVFRCERIIELKESNGQTQLHQTENYSGFLVHIMWGKLNKHAGAMLASMNEGLKQKVEA